VVERVERAVARHRAAAGGPAHAARGDEREGRHGD
jgi:hypothetical protein